MFESLVFGTLFLQGALDDLLQTYLGADETIRETLEHAMHMMLWRGSAEGAMRKNLWQGKGGQ